MDISTLREFRKTLRRLERLIDAHLNDDPCCSGVTLAQCHAILAIDECGETTAGDLADALGLDKSTLSRTVNGLVDIGLVRRDQDSADRRVVRLRLSDRGRETVSAIHQANDAHFERVFERIPAGRRTQVMESFQALVDAMESGRKEPVFCCSKEKGGK